VRRLGISPPAGRAACCEYPTRPHQIFLRRLDTGFELVKDWSDCENAFEVPERERFEMVDHAQQRAFPEPLGP
jgi:hypothetical protein